MFCLAPFFQPEVLRHGQVQCGMSAFCLVMWTLEAGAPCVSVLRPTFSVCERGGQVQILL